MSGIGTSADAVASAASGAYRFQQAAHDIRTPLTTVVQGVDAILELRDGDGTVATHLFDVLRRNVAWMGDLLDSSFTTAGDSQTFDLAAIAREAVQTLEPSLSAREQSVTIESPKRLVAINADRRSVTRAIFNLIENASKFGPRGDRIVVAIRPRDQGFVVLVRDHGPGIPRAERHRVFRPFYRGAAATSVSGLGLGLATVHEVADAHGGSVGVSCAHGTTSVWMYLPRETQGANV